MGAHELHSMQEAGGFLFTESQRESAENFPDFLREDFCLLMVSGVFRVKNWNYFPCTDSVDDGFFRSQLALCEMADVNRAVYN